jgi:Ca2+-binding EF-hand superfamily protein
MHLQFDSDNDGKITKAELSQLLDAVGYTLTWDHNRERTVPPTQPNHGMLHCRPLT